MEFGKEGVTWVEDSPHVAPCRTVSSQQVARQWFCSGNLGNPSLSNNWFQLETQIWCEK